MLQKTITTIRASVSYRVRVSVSTFGLAFLSCFGGTAIANASGTPQSSLTTAHAVQK